MTYDALLMEAEKENLIVEDIEMHCHDGLIHNRYIAIRKSLPTSAAKACVLAEEIGHAKLTAGNILDQSDIDNRQQELKARRWAFDKMVGLIGIIEAFKSGCRNRYEMAEFLGVTEQFLQEALNAYRQKYGCEVAIDHYLIRFMPCLDVVQMF